MKFRNYIFVAILLISSFLRLWKLDTVPVSMFGDELDVGYQAYSIFKTGADYYGNSWPIHFHSLAEWRTPLYLYSAVPSVAVFGISPYGVRLPAAIFGILSILFFYLLIKELTENKSLALLAAGVLGLSPWHIQYSRAGFEVTLLLFLIITALWLFFKSLKDGKWLWVSTTFFALTPWVYSTAKLFTPILLLFLLIVWRKEVFKLTRKYLVFAALALVIVAAPITYDTIFGEGTQRFGYISVFTDPTTEPEVGTARLTDARARGELGEGIKPAFIDRVIHNKFTFWGGNVLRNYLQPFSSEFLFNNGDPNLRHSIEGMGMFYKIEIVTLILGLIFFFTAKKYEKRVKLLIVFWILAGVVPAAVTRDGGNHATRLILILPPLIFLISYGLSWVLEELRGTFKSGFLFSYGVIFLGAFLLYLHNYWAHNPRYSERWWHAGFQESIQSLKPIVSEYDKVVITSASEPPWIFFAGWYEYPPDKWQKEFPIGNDVNLPGFGKVSHTDKFYFGTPEGGLYEWGKVIDKKTIYVASEKEVKVNLILEPERTPGDLRLIRSIAYPSGEPAFYVFSGKND